MPCTYDHRGAQVSTPAQDFNVQTPAAQATGTANPPIPADHEQQTPEFLQTLIQELNKLRQEQSELYAKMYPQSANRQDGPPVRPPYEEMEEYRRQDEEYDRKISAIKMQLQELRTLLARKVMPEPEIAKVMGPTQPPSPEPPAAGG